MAWYPVPDDSCGAWLSTSVGVRMNAFEIDLCVWYGEIAHWMFVPPPGLAGGATAGQGASAKRVPPLSRSFRGRAYVSLRPSLLARWSQGSVADAGCGRKAREEPSRRATRSSLMLPSRRQGESGQLDATTASDQPSVRPWPGSERSRSSTASGFATTATMPSRPRCASSQPKAFAWTSRSLS